MAKQTKKSMDLGHENIDFDELMQPINKKKPMSFEQLQKALKLTSRNKTHDIRIIVNEELHRLFAEDVKKKGHKVTEVLQEFMVYYVLRNNLI